MLQPCFVPSNSAKFLIVKYECFWKNDDKKDFQVLSIWEKLQIFKNRLDPKYFIIPAFLSSSHSEFKSYFQFGALSLNLWRSETAV